jgi:hypothetical protein
VLYEPDPEHGSGYIFYPADGSSGIVTHFVEETWRHASDRWSERVGAAISEQLRTQRYGTLPKSSRFTAGARGTTNHLRSFSGPITLFASGVRDRNSTSSIIIVP